MVPIACGGETEGAGSDADASAGGDAGNGAGAAGTGGSQAVGGATAQGGSAGATGAGGSIAQGGSAGTTGVGGSTAQGGSAGTTAGSGGTTGAKSCLDEQALESYCAPPDGGSTWWTCMAEDGGSWSPGAGGCPNNLFDWYCQSYTQLEVRGDQCCYLYNPGGGGCGRPFLVAGEARRAEAVERSDWHAPADARPSELDSDARRALGEEWLEDALLEHASVASFARFSLELLALGAPPELLLGAQRAALDEIEHARLCFGLASGYLGQPVGPGPLPVEGCLDAPSLEEVAARAAREGCVGETLAALVAAEQLERASAPEVRTALDRIARDEASHAELAWQFVAWAIARGGDSVRRAVLSEMRSAMHELRAAPSPRASELVPERISAAHGRLTARARRAAELQALDELIEPCARRLLGAALAPRSAGQSVSA